MDGHRLEPADDRQGGAPVGPAVVGRRPQVGCDPRAFTGNAVLVEDVLAEEGITDLRPYSAKPGQDAFFPDFFVDPACLGQRPDALPEGAEALRGI